LRPTRALAPALLPTLVAASLSGCLETPVAESGGERHRRVDETKQVARGAIGALRSHCAGAPWVRGNLNASGRPRRARLADARRAVVKLIELARKGPDRLAIDRMTWRELLVSLASALEEARCVPAEVARVDRALRLLPPPEPECYPEEYPEYEEDYPWP
jgi:hypothetical protein